MRASGMGDLDPGEAAYRAHMHAIAIKAGETTKRRYGSDPRRNYYSEIGKLGGAASAAARRERFRQAAQAESDGCAIAPPPVLAEPIAPRKSSLAAGLALLEGPNHDPDPTGTRARLILGQA
jgi:hypothetical protein